MKITKCDMDECKEEAVREEVMLCVGYRETSERRGEPIKKHKPFDIPTINTKDLCEKHFKMWCKATHNCFWTIK